MKLPFGEDEQEQAKAETDLTLGIGSLLSIFFGVVLICGIFFGFGYSMGRRNIHPGPAVTAEKPAASSALPQDVQNEAKTKAQQADDSSAFPPDFKTPVPDEARPSRLGATGAAATTTNDRTTPSEIANSRKPDRNQQVIERQAQDPSLTAAAPAHRVTPPTKPRAGTMSAAPDNTDAPILPGHPIMVQIAAVSRQEDAEVLAGALRKRGFSPQVRSGMADKFYHVQVGPFSDKNQAETMKQHLLADGYNAIVK